MQARLRVRPDRDLQPHRRRLYLFSPGQLTFKAVQESEIQIGNWRTEVCAPFNDPHLEFGEKYRRFLKKGGGERHWRLEVDWRRSLEIPSGRLVHDTGEGWALFEEGPLLRFTRPAPARGQPWTLLELDQETNRARILCRQERKDQRHLTFFAHPIDQLLYTYWLSKEESLLIHAAGAISGNRGYAFLGYSGGGKSTLTRLFGRDPNLERLSDDRLIIAREGADWRLFGTPWHGDAQVVSPESSTLKCLCFLKHGEKNSLTPLTPSVAAGKLFAMSFTVLWQRDRRDHALEVASQIVSQLPSYEFAFRPDRTAVDFLRENLFDAAVPRTSHL